MTIDREAASRAVLGRFVMPRTIRTERLQLAPFDMAHEPAFRRFFASNAAIPMGGGPKNAHLSWRTFAAYAGQWFLYGFGQYAVTTLDGEFVGYCGLWFPENKPEIEIGWSIFPQHQRRGYAREAGRAVKAIAIGQGIPSLVSYILPDNPASQGVAMSLGGANEGMIDLGRYQTGVWRYDVPTPERLPEPADILLETNVMPLSVGTKRLSLAPFRADHFDAYAAHEADEEAQRYVNGVSDRYDSWRKFASSLGQWALRGYGMYAIEHDGAFVGRAGIHHPVGWPERELGWHVHRAWQGNGYATEAAAAIRAVAIEQGLQRLVSYIDPDNAPSVAVAKRLGAKDAGRTMLPVGEALTFEHLMEPRVMKEAA